jgi:glycosyltransferase involved in cell wall biosynthesis
MRILVANKFWYRRGGLERIMFDEIAWLEAGGHEVAHFSTKHPSNDPSPWSDYFAAYFELGSEAALSPLERVRAAGNMFWNVDAERAFERLVSDFRPDVVHAHGIHRHLSPSILGVARRHGVPVVQTLHDYHHVCPADVLLYKGVEPCEPRRCGVLWYGPCVRGRCLRHSLSASVLSAAETSFQRATSAYSRGVAVFVSPSMFVAEQMRRGRWEVPCKVVPNAIAVEREAAEVGSGFCVIGRLSREKGVDVALEAARRAGVGLTVAGEGPACAVLRAAYPEFSFVGRLDGPAVATLVARSRAVVVPSVCFENASMSVLEAMAAGKPVLASAIGGIPEQVTNEDDGLLVPPGDVEALAQAMKRVEADDSLCRRLGHAARQTVATRFSPESHLDGLLAAYYAAGARGTILEKGSSG